ncbi:MAG TPA: TrpB-like pyridoxal-phosphate dependent enzyme, partial [Candidatus Edwardsbacteria bacterium]|nr:TrpB-like pyridoxal-phosphate dependent enzyme [Candidatus Edwardsbacteria bacterium]
EGIVPAPESAHAVAAVLQEGRRCQREGRAEVILFNLSGHGLFDLGAYQAFLDGSLAGERSAVAAAATA